MKPHCKSYLIFCIVEVSHTWCIKSHDINNLFTLKRIKTKKNNITSMSTYCKYIIHNQGEPWRAHFFFYGVIDNKYKATCGTPLQSSIRHPFIHPSIRPHSSFPDCCNPREGVFLAVRSDDLTKLTAFSLSHWALLKPAGQVEKPLQACPMRPILCVHPMGIKRREGLHTAMSPASGLTHLSG